MLRPNLARTSTSVPALISSGNDCRRGATGQCHDRILKMCIYTIRSSGFQDCVRSVEQFSDRFEFAAFGVKPGQLQSA